MSCPVLHRGNAFGFASRPGGIETFASSSRAPTIGIPSPVLRWLSTKRVVKSGCIPALLVESPASTAAIPNSSLNSSLLVSDAVAKDFEGVAEGEATGPAAPLSVSKSVDSPSPLRLTELLALSPRFRLPQRLCLSRPLTRWQRLFAFRGLTFPLPIVDSDSGLDS